MLSSLCFSSCGRGFYESEPCAGDHDQICVPITNCSTGEFQLLSANATEDAVCTAISLCNPLVTANSTAIPDPRCEFSDSILCAQLEPANCTSSSGNASVASSRCPFLCNECGSFERTPETTTSDRVCNAIALCDPTTTFVTTEANPSTDRVCQSLTDCVADSTFETSLPQYDADRSCAPCSVCGGLGAQFESSPCTVDSDRTCANVTTCSSASEYAAAPPTITTDRVCLTVTSCDLPPTGFVDAVATPTSDAVCTPCTVCESTAADLLLIVDTSSSIEEAAFGGSPGTFDFVKAFVRNITLSTTNLGAGISNATRIAAITFDSTARVAFDFGGGLVGPTGFTQANVLTKVDTLLKYVSVSCELRMVASCPFLCSGFLRRRFSLRSPLTGRRFAVTGLGVLPTRPMRFDWHVRYYSIQVCPPARDSETLRCPLF
jgi:hypothetical protein